MGCDSDQEVLKCQLELTHLSYDRPTDADRPPVDDIDIRRVTGSLLGDGDCRGCSGGGKQVQYRGEGDERGLHRREWHCRQHGTLFILLILHFLQLDVSFRMV